MKSSKTKGPGFFNVVWEKGKQTLDFFFIENVKEFSYLNTHVHVS